MVAVKAVGVFAMVVVVIKELITMMTMTTIKIKQNPVQNKKKTKPGNKSKPKTKSITWPLNLHPSPNTLQRVRGEAHGVGIQHSALKMITTHVNMLLSHTTAMNTGYCFAF